VTYGWLAMRSRACSVTEMPVTAKMALFFPCIYFQFRSMGISFTSRVTRVNKVTTVANDTTLFGQHGYQAHMKRFHIRLKVCAGRTVVEISSFYFKIVLLFAFRLLWRRSYENRLIVVRYREVASEMQIKDQIRNITDIKIPYP